MNINPPEEPTRLRHSNGKDLQVDVQNIYCAGPIATVGTFRHILYTPPRDPVEGIQVPCQVAAE